MMMMMVMIVNDDGDGDDEYDGDDGSPFQAWLEGLCRTVADSHKAAPARTLFVCETTMMMMIWKSKKYEMSKNLKSESLKEKVWNE